MSNKKKPHTPRPPAPPETIPPRNVTAGDPADDWADLIVPPVLRVRPVGSAVSARSRAARLWWRPRRLP